MNVDINSINRQPSSLLSQKTAEFKPTEKINLQANQNQNQKLSSHQVTKSKIQDHVNQANKILASHQTTLKFKLYDKLHTYYIQIIDKKTNQVIQEIPSKKFLDMYYLMLQQNGLLIDKKS